MSMKPHHAVSFAVGKYGKKDGSSMRFINGMAFRCGRQCIFMPLGKAVCDIFRSAYALDIAAACQVHCRKIAKGTALECLECSRTSRDTEQMKDAVQVFIPMLAVRGSQGSVRVARLEIK